MESKILFVLIVMILVFTLLLLGILSFVRQFQRTKKGHLEELLQAQIEVQDQTLNYLGRELHDNVGQLLTVAHLQLSSLRKEPDSLKRQNDLEETLVHTHQELRSLSRSLNSSRISEFGLHRELVRELERIQQTRQLELIWQIPETESRLTAERALILYRVMQEFISNTLRYAGATQLRITLQYTVHELHVTLQDNGKGFDRRQVQEGTGLINIRKRLEALHAKDICFDSSPGEGTILSVTLPLEVLA